MATSARTMVGARRDSVALGVCARFAIWAQKHHATFNAALAHGTNANAKTCTRYEFRQAVSACGASQEFSFEDVGVVMSWVEPRVEAGVPLHAFWEKVERMVQFESADTNHDGKLSRAEFERLVEGSTATSAGPSRLTASAVKAHDASFGVTPHKTPVARSASAQVKLGLARINAGLNAVPAQHGFSSKLLSDESVGKFMARATSPHKQFAMQMDTPQLRADPYASVPRPSKAEMFPSTLPDYSTKGFSARYANASASASAMPFTTPAQSVMAFPGGSGPDLDAATTSRRAAAAAAAVAAATTTDNFNVETVISPTPAGAGTNGPDDAVKPGASILTAPAMSEDVFALRNRLRQVEAENEVLVQGEKRTAQAIRHLESEMRAREQEHKEMSLKEFNLSAGVIKDLETQLQSASQGEEQAKESLDLVKTEFEHMKELLASAESRATVREARDAEIISNLQAELTSVRTRDDGMESRASRADIALAELRGQSEKDAEHLKQQLMEAESRATRLVAEHATMREELAAANAGRRVEREQREAAEAEVKAERFAMAERIASETAARDAAEARVAELEASLSIARGEAASGARERELEDKCDSLAIRLEGSEAQRMVLERELTTAQQALIMAKEEALRLKAEERTRTEELMDREQRVLQTLMRQLHQSQTEQSKLNDYTEEMDAVYESLEHLYENLNPRRIERVDGGDDGRALESAAAPAPAPSPSPRHLASRNDARAQSPEEDAATGQVLSSLRSIKGELSSYLS